MLEVKGHMCQGQPKGHDIGRWARVNVKLDFLSTSVFQAGMSFYFSFFDCGECAQLKGTTKLLSTVEDI